MAKRQAYTRRNSGETRKHDRRVRHKCLELNARDIRAACDAALRRADVPINMAEERHLKQVIKDMKAEEAKKNKQK